MKIHEIYVEGFRATGTSAKAVHVGEAKGYDFNSAVQAYVKGLSPREAQLWTQHPSHWTYLGSRAFPTKEEAQRSYG